MRPPLGRWWLLIWLQPLSAPPAGAVRGEEEAAAALAVPRCKALKEMDLIKTSESDCYCYNRNSRMEWKYMWSTLQVKITSSGLLNIAYITGRHNCQYPETILSFIKCVIHNFWTPKESNEVTIIINPYGETMCFSVKPVRKIFIYTISVNRNIVDFKLFLVFVAGILLFFYAKTLSRSPIFFYSSGTVLGVLMTLVFVLLLVKRFIPKYSTFWALMVGCWFASVYVVCHLMEDLKWLWHENRIYILGYVLVAGFLSFAVCYKHGPLVDERSVTLLTWTLRLLALVLIYCGVTVPQGSYAALILILASRSLRYPLKAFTYMRWKMKKWWTSKKPVFKYLTEDEYREQADAETSSALEELRGACRRPDFPTWLVVSRLQAPNKYFTLGTDRCPGEPMMRKLSVALLFLQCSDLHRAANVRTNSDLMFDTEGRKHNFHMRSDRCRKFADFVLGGSHLSPEEISLHEEQYGFGGAFLEEQLFNLRTA